MLKTSALPDKVYRSLTIIAVVLIMLTVVNVAFSNTARANETTTDDLDGDGLTNSEELEQTEEKTRTFAYDRKITYHEEPSQVENLELVERTSDHIEISWEKTDNTTRYNIYRSIEGSTESINIDTISDTTEYTDKDIDSSESYEYKVSAENQVGEGEKSDALEVERVPEKIEGLETDNVDLGGVELSWSSSSADRYFVYRSSYHSDKGSQIGEVTETSFTDTDFECEETYYYRVAGKNSATVGPVSDPLEVTTPSSPDIPIPIDLSSSYIESDDHISISWDYDDEVSSDDDVYLYKDYSGDTQDEFEKIASLDPTIRSYTDQVFETGTYTYKVEYYSNTYQYGEKSDPTSTFVDDGGGDGPIIQTTSTSTYSEKEFNEIYWNLDTPDRDHQGLLKSIEIDNIILGEDSEGEIIRSTTPVKIRLESGAFDGKLDVEKEVAVMQSPATYSISVDIHERLFHDSFEESDLNRWDSYSSELADYQWELSIISDQKEIVQLDRPYFDFEWCSNPLESDTDGEGLNDGEELEAGTDPLLADTDRDGLNDHAELNDHDTDPTQHDTDKDGLSDSTEVGSTGQVVLADGSTKSGGLDPLTPDTDGDGVVDGEELNGYETVYITDSEEEKTREINDADPLNAYKDTDGEWMDTDSDNIPDVIEADPSRMDDSRFDDLPNIEMMRGFKERYKENDENPDLFAKQFNPYLRDTIDPMAFECRAQNYLIWESWNNPNAQAKVNIEFLDPTGIDYIKIKNKDQGNSKIFHEYDLSYDDGVAELNEWIPISYTKDYLADGWDLGITIMDENGNVIKDEKHVKSKLAYEWQDFTDWITDVVWGAVDDAVSTASEMASTLVDWVKGEVSSMFSSVVDPIVDGLENWAEGIQSEMDNFFTELSDWEDGDGDEDATMEAGTGLMMSFMGQQDKAEQVTDVLSKVMNFIEPFQEYLSPFGAIGAISSVFDADNDGGSGLFNNLKNLENPEIGEIWDTITESSLLEGFLSKEIDLGKTVPSINAMKNFLEEADLPGLSIVSQVIDFLPEEGEPSETISVEVALLIGIGMGVYGAHPSPSLVGLSTLTNYMSWMLNLLSWTVDGMWGQFYGLLAASVGSISFISGWLAGIVQGYQVVIFVASPLLGLYLALS